MSRGGWPHGSATGPDGPRYFSPSALTVADPDSNEGCLRKYWYQYIGKLKEDQTKAQAIGTELHAQIENYLLTGEKAMNSLALSGLFMIPEPGPDLLVEHDITGGKLITAPLRARGVPIAGMIDLIHRRGTNRGVTDVEDTIDPPGTVEVLDWKTTSDPKWIKSPKEVANTIQMTTYGKWATTVYPDTEWVRLSHGYFVTKGRHTPRKVTLRVHRDQIDDRWNHIDKLAGSIIDVAKEIDPDKIPGNPRACDAFRGCMHRDYCTVAMHTSLSELGFSDELELPGEKPVGLLASLKLKTAAASAPAGASDIEAEKIRLAKEEVLNRWPDLDNTFIGFQETGLGFPKLSGDAAKAYETLFGKSSVAEGPLAEHDFEDPSILAEVLAEARGLAAGEEAPAQEVAPIVSPETPQEQPKPSAADTALEEAAAEPKPKTRAKKKKDEPQPEPVVANTGQRAAEHGVFPDAGPVVDTQADLIEAADTKRPAQVIVYIDAIVSEPMQSLWPYINQLTAGLATKYKVDDIRDVPNDNDLAYGKWKGKLGFASRALFSKLQPGHYTFENAALTEIGQVALEALRDVIARNGGWIVRGTR